VGKNLCSHLAVNDEVNLLKFGSNNTPEQLNNGVSQADVIFHLAGINRPKSTSAFKEINTGFTQTLVNSIRKTGCKPHVILSSSIQATLDSPYGTSKQQAEEILSEFADETGTAVSIFRLKNIFGKWCRPNYNSVTATFCHNIANDLPIQISDPNYELELVYIDDVVDAFINRMKSETHQDTSFVEPDPIPSYTITLNGLANRIRCFRDMQKNLNIPDFSNRFHQQLYATYLSYVPTSGWEYAPEIRTDERGNLAELVKSEAFGQVFVSRTKPGITRGNHYHHTKTEKFIVLSGEGLIRFRQIDGTEVLEFPVRGLDYRIVDIPPGYTHSISNIGQTEMITLFWASERFDPECPDTYFLPVDIT